jgi:PAS domain-containing protein
MLVTPGNGIMFLASMTFLAIGVVGWFSFPKRDLSAKLWMLAFVIAGFAPLLGAVLAGPGNAWAFVASTCLFALSFFVFGLSLKALHDPRLQIKEYVLIAVVMVLAYALVLGYGVATATEATQIILFALGNSVAAAWATQQALQLSHRHPSIFAGHLTIIFGTQTVILFLRIPQVMRGDERRLWESGAANEFILMTLCLLGIIKAISYFSLRFEEIRQKLATESDVIHHQAAELARKNAEIASAMHVVPVACVVTHPSLEILYLNAEARRIFGEQTSSKTKLSDWTLGFQGQSELTVSAARYLFIRTADSPVTQAMSVEVKGLDGESSVAQWVFSFKPITCTQSIIESIWNHMPRIDNRAWLVCDASGIVVSAQSAWGEVLGPYAVFQAPELRFGGIQQPHAAQGLDLWASLQKLGGDDPQLRRAQAAHKQGKATSLLVRDPGGGRLSCGLSPLRCESSNGDLWLVEAIWKPTPSTPRASRQQGAAQTAAAILSARVTRGDHDSDLAGLRFDR